jgi:hypothetical protein
MTRILVFWIAVGLVSLVGGYFGYAYIREDLVGIGVGMLLSCLPVFLLAVIMGFVQLTMESKQNDRDS